MYFYVNSPAIHLSGGNTLPQRQYLATLLQGSLNLLFFPVLRACECARVCGCAAVAYCMYVYSYLLLFSCPFSSFVSFLFLSKQHLELLYSLRPSPVPVAASNGPNGVRRSSVLFQDGLNPFKRESSHHLSF